MANSRDRSVEEDNNSPRPEKGKETARSLIDQAKMTATNAYDAAKEHTSSVIDEQKTGLSEGLGEVADAVRRVGVALTESGSDNKVTGYTAQYATAASQKIAAASRYFDGQDLRSMARDVESYARRNPAVFLGAAFALGIVAARFIKSSPAPLVEAEGAAPRRRRSPSSPGTESKTASASARV